MNLIYLVIYLTRSDEKQRNSSSSSSSSSSGDQVDTDKEDTEVEKAIRDQQFASQRYVYV